MPILIKIRIMSRLNSFYNLSKKNVLQILAMSRQGGQVIILATLAIGGAILGATTIAGLLMVYQVRQTVDVQDSARAIFASDAGIEWGQFQFYKDPAIVAATTPPVLSNGTSFALECFDINVASTSCDGTGLQPISYIRSLGRAGVSRTVVRALEISFAP